MTEQPIEPRERGEDQNPETSSPLPDDGGEDQVEEAVQQEADARYAEALTGINVGSDTRAGSLRGGSASGSEHDPDQERIDESLASEGMSTPAAEAEPRSFGDPGDPGAGQDEVVNTGQPSLGPRGDPAEGRRDLPPGGDDADAATG